MKYRIVRVYERYYIEAEERNELRRISPRGGFGSLLDAREWYVKQQGIERARYEVVMEWEEGA